MKTESHKQDGENGNIAILYSIKRIAIGELGKKLLYLLYPPILRQIRY
jgi:hypothetical protein